MLYEKGRTFNVNILESSHPDLDMALRDVVRGMPRWNMKMNKGSFGPIVIPIIIDLYNTNRDRDRGFGSSFTGFTGY